VKRKKNKGRVGKGGMRIGGKRLNARPTLRGSMFESNKKGEIRVTGLHQKVLGEGVLGGNRRAEEKKGEKREKRKGELRGDFGLRRSSSLV